MTKVKMLLLPVETARKMQVDLPGNAADWVLMQCPHCTRMCWATIDQERRVLSGDAEAACVKCEQDRVISESFRRMLRGEGGKMDRQPMPIEEARKTFPPMWTIYRAPRDMPGVAFASRVFFGEARTDEVMTADTLEEIRHKVRAAGGCVCLGRSLYDDPVIVETWV